MLLNNSNIFVFNIIAIKVTKPKHKLIKNSYYAMYMSNLYCSNTDLLPPPLSMRSTTFAWKII